MRLVLIFKERFCSWDGGESGSDARLEDDVNGFGAVEGPVEVLAAGVEVLTSWEDDHVHLVACP